MGIRGGGRRVIVLGTRGGCLGDEIAAWGEGLVGLLHGSDYLVVGFYQLLEFVWF